MTNITLFIFGLCSLAAAVIYIRIARQKITAAAIAEYKQQKSSELRIRIKAEKAKARANGEYCGSKIPFGFRVKNGKLLPVAAEQEIIERIRRMAAAGYKQSAIADVLNADGVKTKYGKKWHQSTVRKILSRTA